MSRQLRIQFPGAIYHVTSRGNRRQDIVLDDVDRNGFFDGVGSTVEKYGWQIFASVLMTNHFHLFFRTPQANLSRGMQFLLGGYATWWNQRHQRGGHVFQGRFRGHLVEDETYVWVVSRYVHLNPVGVLVDFPEQWKWSSYAGYLDPERRLAWIDYQGLLDAWRGNVGGSDPSTAYRQYVESALVRPAPSPFDQAIDGWILGSAGFAERVRELISPASRQPTAKNAQRRVRISTAKLLEGIYEVFDIDPSLITARGSRHPARGVFAYLAHCHTDATLRQLAEQLGLSRYDSVPTQIRRVTRASRHSDIRRDVARIEAVLGLARDS
jgi:REP element-mobilizing transposase RayT